MLLYVNPLTRLITVYSRPSNEGQLIYFAIRIPTTTSNTIVHYTWIMADIECFLMIHIELMRPLIHWIGPAVHCGNHLFVSATPKRSSFIDKYHTYYSLFSSSTEAKGVYIWSICFQCFHYGYIGVQLYYITLAYTWA